MAEVNLKELASEIGTSVEKLLQQLSDAGIQKTADDSITEEQKQELLSANKHEDNATPERMTLTRKSRSTLNVGTGPGRSKAVQVEVRKKQTYVKRSTAEEEKRLEEERLAAEAAAAEQEKILAEAREKAKVEAEKKEAEAQKVREEKRKAQEAAKAKAAVAAAKSPEEVAALEASRVEEERLRKIGRASCRERV